MWIFGFKICRNALGIIKKFSQRNKITKSSPSREKVHRGDFHLLLNYFYRLIKEICAKKKKGKLLKQRREFPNCIPKNIYNDVKMRFFCSIAKKISRGASNSLFSNPFSYNLTKKKINNQKMISSSQVDRVLRSARTVEKN